MDIKLPEKVIKIFVEFKKNSFQLYLVGGAVRDLILGKEVGDWDFTTDATPEQILKIFPEGYYNNKFGTVGIPVAFPRGGDKRGASLSARSVSEDIEWGCLSTGPRGVIEITTMRREEAYTDLRHPAKIIWTNQIEKDLARRDFTINAMALGPYPEMRLLDPFDGQSDLKNKLIRAVGEPEKRFHEDALRLIRAVRFAAQLQFTIEQDTFKAILKNAQLIQQISWERIRDELLKILASDNPYEGIVLLKDSALLPYILPEIERCFSVVQEGPKHDRVYDIGEHSLLSLKYCPSPDPLVRLAALIHDIGKPDTKAIQEDGNVTFFGHDVVGAKLAQKLADRLRLSKKDQERLARLVRWHLFPVDERQTDSAIRRFIKNVGVGNIDDMMDVRIGDRLGGGTQKAVSWRMERFSERIKQVLHKPFSVGDLKVNGRDIMKIVNISPGPQVGEILNQLFEEVLEDSSKNNREYLLNRIKELKS